jgi:hypothetical protein
MAEGWLVLHGAAGGLGPQFRRSVLARLRTQGVPKIRRRHGERSAATLPRVLVQPVAELVTLSPKLRPALLQQKRRRQLLLRPAWTAQRVPSVVSDRLNRSSTFMTREIYTHVTPPMQSDAAARVAARVFP